MSFGLLERFSAEREGFEPPEPRSSTVFKTAAIDHSAISPESGCKYKTVFRIYQINNMFSPFLSSLFKYFPLKGINQILLIAEMNNIIYICRVLILNT